MHGSLSSVHLPAHKGVDMDRVVLSSRWTKETTIGESITRECTGGESRMKEELVNMRSAMFFAIVAGFLGLSVCPCGAELDPKQSEEVFEACDANKDGVISKEELKAIDANNDGEVSSEELEAFRAKNAGAASGDEWAKYHYSSTDQGKKGFSIRFYDRDKDETMNKDEFMKMLRMSEGN